jgi:hypothetical protein
MMVYNLFHETYQKGFLICCRQSTKLVMGYGGEYECFENMAHLK